MKLGSADVSKIYLGSTEVSAAYLGSVQVYGGATPVLPYDAEIEYLEATGTQYIDTGVMVSAITKAVFDLRTGFEGNAFLGAYSNPDRFRITDSIGIGGGYYYNAAVFPKSNTRCSIEMSTSGSLKINGTSYNATSGTFSSVSFNNPIYLFDINGQVLAYQTFRLYGAKFYNGETLVSDLVPVRVSTTGYMYDKVSGQLLRNAGTGNFILGEDKNTTLPYSSEVSYLQSDTNSYIDTSVLVSSITKAEYRFHLPSGYTSGAIAGARDGTNGRFQIVDSVGVGGGYYMNTSVYPKANTDFKVEMSTSGSMKINSTSYNASSGAFSSVSYDKSIYLFKINGQEANGVQSRFYTAYFFNGDDVVAAFIPVRLGQVGYMYDRIGKQLYGNAGSGSFSYGGDV